MSEYQVKVSCDCVDNKPWSYYRETQVVSRLDQLFKTANSIFRFDKKQTDIDVSDIQKVSSPESGRFELKVFLYSYKEPLSDEDLDRYFSYVRHYILAQIDWKWTWTIELITKNKADMWAHLDKIVSVK